MDDLVRPFSESSGALTWVEMTPPNAKAMDALCRMFPRARMVHMIRDGRDVAASVARRTWGPDDVESALVWWADQLVAIQHAADRSDPDRVHTVRLESLVGPDRVARYDALVEFLGRGADDRMREYFDEQVTLAQSHSGAWRTGLDPETQARVELLHDEQLHRLADLGVTIPPGN